MARASVFVAALLLSCTAVMAQTEPTKKEVTVFSYKIHYLEAGRGSPVILLHGSGGEGARWMPTIAGLAGEFRVIAPDQIGWGNSDKPLTIYHRGVFAEFLARFMKEIGVPKATLIGQSMGAAVALQMAVNYPQLVDRMVLVNTSGGGFRSANEAPRTGAPDWHARQIANAGTLAESREYLEKMYYNHALITDALVEHNLILRLRSASTAESTQTATARGLGEVTEDKVRAIKTPTLLVWGANDKLSPTADADKLNAAIAGSRKVLIDKAGHYPFIEHPEKFNQVVKEFLKPQS
ncbi:MAG TPA: alpha/beta hydrolase [Xanthobacteraceae bacterium]|nr:alpha/beta hydrolase [Xanthobacteraceae bacterium]